MNTIKINTWLMLSVKKTSSFLLVVAALWYSTSNPALAHESRPLYIKIFQGDVDTYTLSWRTPLSITWDNQPKIQIPDICTPNVTQSSSIQVGIKQVSIRCQDLGPKHQFSIVYPIANPSVSALIDVQLLDKEKRTFLLGPEQQSFGLFNDNASDKTWLAYGTLGVKHIWLGIDHLLFIGCLIFFARGWKKLFWTITGFTLAHSVTLGLASLDVIRVNILPIEAIIALSIMFLAVELTKEKNTTLTWRYPAIVAISFGLLHGFGFASVLADIGLPENDRILSLLFFNFGIEVGQLLFIAALFALVWVAKKISANKRVDASVEGVLAVRNYYLIAAYLIGPLAAFWFWQRLAQF